MDSHKIFTSLWFFASTTVMSASLASGIAQAHDVEIDALPYVDAEYNLEGMREEVNRLIAAERRHMATKDYLKDLAPATVAFSSPLLQEEWERVSRGRSLPALDSSRYMLEAPPASQKSDLEAWSRAVDNAGAQLEHQALRLMNIELLQKYGTNAWKIHNFQTEALLKQLEAAHKALESQKAELNADRKAEQIRAIERIRILEARLADLTYRTIETQLACEALEAQK